MDQETTPTTPGKGSLIGLFITIFVLVFMVVVVGVTLVTFIQPETYASEGRLKLIDKSTINSPDPRAVGTNLVATECETILSDLVLDEVVEKFNLNAEWGRLYANGEKLKTHESLTLLRRGLEVQRAQNTSIISVRVCSEAGDEAAKLANAVIAAYQNQAAKVSPGVSIIVIDRAVPGLRPVRPNKPLNIALGVIVGAVLGAGCAAFVTALTANSQARKRLGKPPLAGEGLKPSR